MPESELTPVTVRTSPIEGPSVGESAPAAPRLTPVPPAAPLATPRFTQCPPPPPDLGEPCPESLAYGLTLPSAVATPGLAEEVAEVILDGHGVQDELIVPALMLVHELAIYACRFTGAGDQIHLALQGAAGLLQVAVYDTHAAHTHPRLAAACDGRRRAALVRVPALVEEHLGAWGFGAAAYPPGAGACTWATLVRPPRSRAV